jgi:hypothetical protein
LTFQLLIIDDTAKTKRKANVAAAAQQQQQLMDRPLFTSTIKYTPRKISFSRLV